MKAGHEAVSHLIQQGCQRILHVTGDLKRNVYADRLKGYRLALFEHGLTYQDELVVVTDLSQEAGIEVARLIQSMPTKPDGLFIANDLCAVSCMSELRKSGFSIPNDIAVVGFNNDPVSVVIEPNLTTINYPGEKMGEIAAQSLINHLNGSLDIQNTNTIILHSELLIRQSSVKKGTN
jgi:LacI family transcriptional regulator